VATDTVTRRLSAILAADVVGYSRLIRADEEGTLAALKAIREEIISPKIAEHHGRVVKLMGDGMLAEFGSVVDAVRNAVATQEAVAEHQADVSEDRRIVFRVGINLGDVVIDGDDIQGDGVNLAARLEALADPGGICISGKVYEEVRDRIAVSFEDSGEQTVKNIDRPVRVWRWSRTAKASAEAHRAAPIPLHQDIRFCTAKDGTQIAYATVGEGPPLVKTANWLNHLEYDWESPIWRHVLHTMAEDHYFVRFDQRGNGLSDWNVSDISFEAWTNDFDTVVDAAGLERFAILGISQGCSVAIDFAVRHPERVSRMILYGGYMRGRNNRGAAVQVEQDEAMIALIKSGWGQENPAFRQVFTSLFVPGATAEQMEWFNELQRRTTTADNAVRQRQIQNTIDVIDQASRVAVPTLVMHVRDDAIVPFEEGRRMAATIPGARLVALDGRNHLILEDEPAWPRFLSEARSFLEAGD
jgi:class 3 adenylate cyclase/pimeloyl-ACP methyl ester carboxylesterase